MSAWTETELELLQSTYHNAKTETIALQLQRTAKSVYMKALHLGLKKSAEYIRSLSSGRPNKLLKTWQPIGTERTDKDGILVRKVSDTGNRRADWRAVHSFIWERENGPIPAGHKVIFKPGMRTNIAEEITLDRVELVSNAELMRRNTVQRYPKEIQQMCHLRGHLTRQINKRSHK